MLVEILQEGFRDPANMDIAVIEVITERSQNDLFVKGGVCSKL